MLPKTQIVTYPTVYHTLLLCYFLSVCSLLFLYFPTLQPTETNRPESCFPGGEAGSSYHDNSARPTIFRSGIAREEEKLRLRVASSLRARRLARASLGRPGRAPVAHARNYYLFLSNLGHSAPSLQDGEYRREKGGEPAAGEGDVPGDAGAPRRRPRAARSYQRPPSWARAASTSGRVPASAACAAPRLRPLCVPAEPRRGPRHVLPRAGRQRRRAGAARRGRARGSQGGARGTCPRALG